MTPLKTVSLVLIAAALLALAANATPTRRLFVDARLLTMDERDRRAEAMLVVGSRIAAVGTRRALERRAPHGTRTVSLGGRTVMPAFVDAHSHFPASHLRRAGLDLRAPPVGTVGTMETLLSRVAASATIRERGSWLIGFGYDDALLAEGRHPTRAELDRAAPDHPVWLAHGSGHMGVASSRALAELGREVAGTGLLRESDAPPLTALLGRLPRRRLLDVLLDARDAYLAAGVATVQNGHAGRGIAWALRASQWLGLLPQRVVVWPAEETLGSALAVGGTRLVPLLPPSGERFVVGALKIIVDGSPQGLTAWLGEPYPASAGTAAGYRGVAVVGRERLNGLVTLHHGAGRQLALHGNGDAAIDAILDALETARARRPREDARHLVVHAQTVRDDQLARMHALDVGASFFPAHTFYWGRWHRDRALGPERARRISPLAAADRLGVRYTLHTDAPVTPMRPMQALWSATERRTLDGEILGPELRIGRLRGLRALTIDAAWQARLETRIGSLEPGKAADFIVLSDDPLTTADVRETQVLETWIGGRRRYRRDASPVAASADGVPDRHARDAIGRPSPPETRTGSRSDGLVRRHVARRSRRSPRRGAFAAAIRRPRRASRPP